MCWECGCHLWKIRDSWCNDYWCWNTRISEAMSSSKDIRLQGTIKGSGVQELLCWSQESSGQRGIKFPLHRKEGKKEKWRKGRMKKSKLGVYWGAESLALARRTRLWQRYFPSGTGSWVSQSPLTPRCITLFRFLPKVASMSPPVRWCKVALGPQESVLQNISRPPEALRKPWTPFCDSLSALLLDSGDTGRHGGAASREGPLPESWEAEPLENFHMTISLRRNFAELAWL